MNRTYTLYKAFGSNLEMPKPSGDRRKKLYSRFGMIAFVGIMVPVSVLVGFVSYILTDLLYQFDGSTYGLLSELHMISAFAMIFGLPLMFSVLYFSSDLRFLTALPISPLTLFTARFWHTYKAENVMTSNVLFAIYIGYFVAAVKHIGISALHSIAVISAVFGFLGSLAIPLLYSAILGMLLMLILKRFNRVSVYYHSSTAMFVIFALMFLISFADYGKVSTENYIESLVNSRNLFVSICNYLFPTNRLTIMSIDNHAVWPLLISVVIFIAVYVIALKLAGSVYQEGLFAAARLGGDRTKHKHGSVSKKLPTGQALFLKEAKVLMRTMTYRINCVYANLLWPIIAIAFLFSSDSYINVANFSSHLQDGAPRARIFLFIGVAAMAFIASGINSIASTSFTREGVHIDLIKYIPVPLDRQIRAKAWIAILFTFIPEGIAVILILVALRIYSLIPLMLLTSLACIVIATMTGLIMDSVSPYTIWSDELSALRGNLNCFFNLAAELIMMVVVGVVSYLLHSVMGGTAAIAVISVILAATAVVIYYRGIRVVADNIDRY
ncbi:MAG: hypothetical protein IJ757_08320 [Clostridiales bacterium]|nr:hypothetical protein [Clostridiales bacterium]